MERLTPARRGLYVPSVEVHGVRNLADAEVELGAGITTVFGPNGAGKTNLLEALYFGLTGRSPRTGDVRDLIAFERPLARVEVPVRGGSEEHRFLAAVSRDEGRRQLIDGKPVAPDAPSRRPPIAVFMPDRLSLVKGSPGARRAHLDQLVGALWPSRAADRRRFDKTLAQRNALLRQIRTGGSGSESLDAWDGELAAGAAELSAGRAGASAELAAPFREAASELGLGDEAELSYRPRCRAGDPEGIVAELREARERDLARGRSTHGPHLDELVLKLSGRGVRRYASQGQQRAALLALLFAERDLLLRERGVPPLMLLDDVMSELDPGRREMLLERLGREGQALITATHEAQVPACARDEIHFDGGRAATAGAGMEAA